MASGFEAYFEAHGTPEMQRIFGVPIVYVAGSVRIQATAMIPRSGYQVDEAEGLQTSLRLWDWLIEASKLIAEGQLVTPRPGHRIEYAIRGQIQIFEVLPMRDQQAAVWDDTEGNCWLIHTKHVGTGTV
jgi:hypothetical protein